MQKVCYVLAYRMPDYIRTRSLLQALKELDNVNLLTAINRPTGWLRYLDTLWQLLKVRVQHNPDCYILGFRGHEMFWPVKLITLGKPLIFDSLMSPYNALVDEGKHGAIGSFIGRFVYHLEKSILRQADHVLTDTELHVEYLTKIFFLKGRHVSALPVGAVESEIKDVGTGYCSADGSNSSSHEKCLEVIFYGSYLPLHGMPVMLEAAARVRDKPIHFTFIGGRGAGLTSFNETVARMKLEKVSHIAWVPYEQLLRSAIPKADLCLGGPFGNTTQSRRIVTGKSSQCLAQGKATVIGIVDEDVGFIDKHNCLLVRQGDPQALADALTWAAQNRERLEEIGVRALSLYRERLSIRCIGDKLKNILQRC